MSWLLPGAGDYDWFLRSCSWRGGAAMRAASGSKLPVGQQGNEIPKKRTYPMCQPRSSCASCQKSWALYAHTGMHTNIQTYMCHEQAYTHVLSSLRIVKLARVREGRKPCGFGGSSADIHGSGETFAPTHRHSQTPA